MTNGRSEPDVELHPWRSTTVQEHRPDGCLCYRATLDEDSIGRHDGAGSPQCRLRTG
jgi:hypothetical protein